MARILVTGASGNLGRRVLEILVERGHTDLVAATRDPAKLADLAAKGVDVRRADFEDAASLDAAFAGADRALLVSTDALDRPGRRREQHLAAVKALAHAGHVVYTSMPNPVGSVVTIAPDHAATEAALEGRPHTILRNNLYMEVLVQALLPALQSGKLAHCRGDGRIAWVSREDCAQAAVGALLDAPKGTFDVSGPEALDTAQVAAIASDVARRPVEDLPLTREDFVSGLVAHGLPEPVAQIYASFDVAAAQGKLDTVTDTVKRFSGKDPLTVRAFLERALRA